MYKVIFYWIHFNKEDEIMNILQKISLILTIIGAINWGLIGLLDFNLVSFLFGEMTMLSRIVYSLVGIAGLINIGLLFVHLEDH